MWRRVWGLGFCLLAKPGGFNPLCSRDTWLVLRFSSCQPWGRSLSAATCSFSGAVKKVPRNFPCDSSLQGQSRDSKCLCWRLCDPPLVQGRGAVAVIETLQSRDGSWAEPSGLIQVVRAYQEIQKSTLLYCMWMSWAFRCFRICLWAGLDESIRAGVRAEPFLPPSIWALFHINCKGPCILKEAQESRTGISLQNPLILIQINLWTPHVFWMQFFKWQQTAVNDLV